MIQFLAYFLASFYELFWFLSIVLILIVLYLITKSTKPLFVYPGVLSILALYFFVASSCAIGDWLCSGDEGMGSLFGSLFFGVFFLISLIVVSAVYYFEKKE